MSEASLMYWNDQLGKVAPRTLKCVFSITGAKASSPAVANTAMLTAYDAISAQSTIDNFLGTTNEFLIAAFDSTSMGTDAFACIVNMNGQCKKVLSTRVSSYSGTNFATVGETATVGGTALTSTSLSSQSAVGANGNIAVRSVLTNLDGLTSGLLMVEIEWISK